MTLLSLIARLLKPYRYRVMGLMISGLLWGVLCSFMPYVFKRVIDAIATHQDLRHTLLWVWSYVIVYGLLAMNFRWADAIKMRWLPSLKGDTAAVVFDRLLGRDWLFYQQEQAGSVANRLHDMVIYLESLVLFVDEVHANFWMLLIAIALLWGVQPWMAGVACLWVVVFYTFSWWLSKGICARSRATSRAYSHYAGGLVDTLSNMMSVLMFHRHTHERSYLSNRINALVEADRETLRAIQRMRWMQDSSLVVVLAAMVFLLVKGGHRGVLSVGDFVLVLSLMTSLFQSMWQITNRLPEAYKSLGKCQESLSMMQGIPRVQSLPDAPDLVVNGGAIAFEHVGFAYPGGVRVFDDLNLKIEAGSKVGLVGYSGAGKTTLVHLLFRFYDVDHGRMTIDGQCIQAVSLASLREAISLIPQDTSLFHRTLKENIRYGRPEASDEAVIEAARRAQCHDFIMALPEGYETHVGERGVKLSGGQRQRIALARGLLKQAPIMVLDEATSALDSKTEQAVDQGLKALPHTQTMLVIAHRLSTLRAMDRIIVLDHGKVLEVGTHEALISRQGHYARLWEMQSHGCLPLSPE